MKTLIDFEGGEVVWLDKGKPNKSKVKIISQTPRKLITKVQGENSRWEVMTYRLSKLTTNNN